MKGSLRFSMRDRARTFREIWRIPEIVVTIEPGRCGKSAGAELVSLAQSIASKTHSGVLLQISAGREVDQCFSALPFHLDADRAGQVGVVTKLAFGFDNSPFAVQVAFGLQFEHR